MYQPHPPEKLQELQDKAEGPDALPDERKEMEELKALLPEIQEKVEEATEGQKMASTASEAVNRVLVSLRLSTRQRAADLTLSSVI